MFYPVFTHLEKKDTFCESAPHGRRIEVFGTFRKIAALAGGNNFLEKKDGCLLLHAVFVP